MGHFREIAALATAAISLFWASAAQASHLEVGPHAPAWMRIGADALLTLHIGGGAIGIISGAAALVYRKGSPGHRAAGKVFFIAMLVAYTVATAVAPFLGDSQRTNTVAGVMALYLLLSGWATARRPEFRAGVFEYVGLAVALSIAAAGLFFMEMGARDPSGMIDGAPPQAFIIFIAAGVVSALGELNVIVRRTISTTARLSRHLWRMCFSLFIASGSFFLGQQPVMPHWMRGSSILILCALAPLAAMLFWLVWVRLSRRFKPPRQVLSAI